jgi:hypothetical protein
MGATAAAAAGLGNATGSQAGRESYLHNQKNITGNVYRTRTNATLFLSLPYRPLLLRQFFKAIVKII